MKDQNKTKTQLISELQELRKQFSELQNYDKQENKVGETYISTELEKEAILDSLLEHVVHQDKEMKILWVNKAACDSVGKSLAELVGQYCYKIWPKRSDTCPDCPVAKAIATSKPHEIEKSTPDGRDWLIRGYPVQDQNGDITGAVEVTLEITRRKKSEKVLRESEERYRKVLEQSFDGFSLVDNKGMIIEWNKAQEKIAGLKQKDVLGKYVWDVQIQIVPEEIKSVKLTKQLKQGFFQALKDKDGFQKQKDKIQEQKILSPNGVSKTVQTTSFNIFIDGVTMIGTIMRDITLREKAKEKLRESEKLYRNLVETTSAIAWEVDITTLRFTYISPLIKAFSGFSSEQWIDFNFWAERIHPEDREEAVRYCQAETAKGLNHAFNYRLITANGSIIWIRDVVSVIKEQGKPVTLRGYFIDITEQVLAEEKLRESEKRFRTMFETNHAIMLLIDPTNGKIENANPAACKYYGYSHKKFIKEVFIKNLNTLSEKQIKIEMENALNEKRNYFLFKHKLASGKIRDVEVYSSKTSIHGRELLYSIIHDITERKKAEEALYDNEKLLRQVIDASPYTIYVKDREGRYILVNKKMAESHNTTAEKLVGRTDISVATKWLTTPEKIKKFRESELAVINKKQPLFIKEDKFTFSDGSERWYQTVKSPLSLKDNPNCIMEIAVDITERKQAEEALRESEKKLALLIHNIPGMVYKAFPDWTAETISGSKELCGYSNEELISKETNWLSIIHPDDKETVFSVSSELPKENKSIVQTYRIINKEGNIRWIEDHKTSLFSDGGKFIGIDGIVLDITERKMAEEIYRDLVEKAGIAIVIDDLDGKFIYFNNRFAELFGYKANEIRKKSISNLVHPDDIAEVMKTHSSRLAGKSVPSRYEFRGIKKDGSVINIETDIVILKEGNSYVGTRSYLWDISQRKHSEETLREQSETIRSLVETSQDWIWSIDLQGQHTYSNPAVELILGYKPNELVGKPSFDIMHEKDRQTIEAEIPRWISEKQGWRSNVIRWKHKNGSWRYLESNAVPIIDAKGEIVGFRGVDRDITERRQTEAKLQESEEKYRLIVENAHDGIEITQDDRIIFANSRFAEMLGFTADELENVAFSQFFTKEATQDLYERQKKRDTGLPLPYQYETTFLKKNRTIIDVDVKYEIIDYKGKPATFSIIRDITDQKKSAQEKAILEKQLRRAQKLETIGTMAGGIAHDFNNILAPIMGYTDMALHNLEKTDPLYNDLQNVLKGAHRAKELVKQILLFSKQSEKERQPLAMQVVIKEALKLIRPSIPTTIEIRQQIDNSCNKVLADATQIHQVIVNLCTNAWQAMEKKGGIITIELNQVKIDASIAKLHPDLDEAEYVRLSITDTGPGMDEETQERIFEPFFTTKTVNKGTGLGLSVVHGIVLSHKGDIHVYSQLGKGTTFDVYLPPIKSEEAFLKTKDLEITGGSESVLVVDDETAVAELVKRILENFGYNAKIFNNGLDALQAIKKQPNEFDLMISDLTMPQMTGLDLADRLHKEYPEFPVMIMTGFSDSITESTKDRYGIKEVISKPIAVKDLTAAVRKIFDK